MSKLTVVIGELEAVRDKIGFEHSCTKADMFCTIEECPTPEQIWSQHEQTMYKQSHLYAPVKMLCADVALLLRTASEQMMILKAWAGGHSSSQVNPDDLLEDALNDVIAAFKLFRVLPKHREMETFQTRPTIIGYLGCTFTLAIALARIIIWPGEFFDCWSEFQEHLKDFDFDSSEALEQSLIENPTLSGVLPPLHATPSSFLPVNPEPPVFIRNPGPYGRAIVKNTRSRRLLPRQV